MTTPRRLLRLSIAVGLLGMTELPAGAHPTLSAPFEREVLVPRGEAPHDLRFFTTAVKTDSRRRIITGDTTDPVKNLVGAEAAGERGGMQRHTKIMFGADYFNGRPDPGTRIDPNNPIVKSGNEFWPHPRDIAASFPPAAPVTEGRRAGRRAGQRAGRGENRKPSFTALSYHVKSNNGVTFSTRRGTPLATNRGGVKSITRFTASLAANPTPRTAELKDIERKSS